MNHRVRWLLGVACLLATLVAAPTAALASVHVTESGFYGDVVNGSLTSTGDAGSWLGNWSGISGVPTETQWFNQDVAISDVGLESYVETYSATLDDTYTVMASGSPDSTWWARSTNGLTYGAHTQFVGNATVSAEGVYSVEASGSVAGTETVEVDPYDPDSAVVTLTVSAQLHSTQAAAFGIDKTRATVTTDVQPYYSGVATVTIAATDTLSGVQQYQISVDGGPRDYQYNASEGTTYSVPVRFGPGTHTVSWHVLDHAGNIASGSSTFVVRPLGFIPTLSKVAAKVSKRRVALSGTISGQATSQNVTLKIDKKSRSKWKLNAKTFTVVVAKFGSTYKLPKKAFAKGTYRVTAYSGGGHSKAITFVVR